MFQKTSLVSIMGCCNTKSMTSCGEGVCDHEGGSRKYLPQISLDGSSSQILRGLPEERPDFTSHQKQIVRESWGVIQKDISRVGVVMFMG
ncbi:hypothetical protein ACOMHN_022025 [Nucella lapillus]